MSVYNLQIENNRLESVQTYLKIKINKFELQCDNISMGKFMK